MIAWIAEAWRRLNASEWQNDYQLSRMGSLAALVAGQEWKCNVFDPRQSDGTLSAKTSKQLISKYIRDGLGWTWEPAYRGDGDFEWCGAFAAWCWAQAGLRADLRKTYFASTYRLDRYARYQSVNGEKNRGTGRLIAEMDEHSTSLPWEPRAGDILLIGPSGSGYGKHICLVESFADGVFKTIEGNGTGRTGDGRHRQGVVRAERKLGGDGWHARRLIRPSAEDIVW